MSITKPVLVLVLFLMLACNSTKKEVSTTDSAVFNSDKVLQQNATKMKEVAASLTNFDSFPRNVKNNKTDWDFVGVTDWCSGFWPGALWYAYEASGDEQIKVQAEKFTAPLKTIAYTPADNHDIGFMVYCSYGNGYRLTGNEEYKEILLAAADTLATLYNPTVGTILSWPSQKHKFKYNTIIDNMMNLELLFWAAKNGGDQKLYDLAKSHAEKTMQHIVRKDDAVYHVGSFDEETGEFLRGYTHQGYATESMWARGQGWGVYGFAVAYRETGDKAFLDTAIRLADHYMDRLPEDKIPFWDFDDPKIPNAPRDASAAAVVACGMYELAGLVKDEALKKKYIDAATSYVEALSSKEYLSGDVNQALLLHSTGHYPKNSEIDVPIVYADYYYMEALVRLNKLNKTNSAVVMK
ncbi:glucuronyl hydrolase [Algibacter amylolyticus]|uniref:Glucuronyl hydrolase n=1 Tax=Algibacter amylolyticus TaxID=1608400 RepID=A0A5M7BA35_9FLAO|nr:glycoside hydrolase family 88 protein [Algibacter amylolyticus]KAA5825178.1 glucuronyl hydrolase [Algibacter amylolyticus]MBB5268709.1 unsaturated chondroitin disaccharide hydrolase [Algibacter amylolyticus]TSJ77672.1 glucuronyl hydrolase [Algibacter amylolyticus]